VSDPAEYGELWADIYDDHPRHPSARDAERAADLLGTLAGDLAVVEFGIGTGRVALPLAARGFDVHGMDASPAMLNRLAAKPGADRLTVAVADFTRHRMAGRFSLVYAVFNAVLLVPTKDGQVRCFRNAAAHLDPGGHFVVEAYVPDFKKLAGDEQLLVRQLDDDGAWLLSTRYDTVRQLTFGEAIRVGGGRTRRYPIRTRYAWPSELDLMAELAGFVLVARYMDWQRAPFTAASRNHVSVYRLSNASADANPERGLEQ
jgi:SAM-dependent methyltransferase